MADDDGGADVVTALQSGLPLKSASWGCVAGSGRSKADPAESASCPAGLNPRNLEPAERQRPQRATLSHHSRCSLL